MELRCSCCINDLTASWLSAVGFYWWIIRSHATACLQTRKPSRRLCGSHTSTTVKKWCVFLQSTYFLTGHCHVCRGHHALQNVPVCPHDACSAPACWTVNF
jgi:hypothetical protein